jgi:regulation of enolase protein 1 (concanavalin A-like superfamily)
MTGGPYDATAWMNEPPEWSIQSDVLELTTGRDTDFWQSTFYGFRRDDGHFLHRQAEGDFTAQVEFEGRYETLYDQAGLMLRIDERNWIKLGIEHSDGVTNFSLVCTRDGLSDWSVTARPLLTGPQAVRLTRVGSAAIAHYRDAEGGWQLMRLCPFPDIAAVRVGPMACSPQRTGFQVRFTRFAVDPPIANPLHG